MRLWLGESGGFSRENRDWTEENGGFSRENGDLLWNLEILLGKMGIL